MKDLIEKLRGMEEMDFKEPATEEQIAAFEQEHEVKLPEAYKEWLRFSDGGELFGGGGDFFRGVAHPPLIEVIGKWGQPEGYITIGKTSFGDPICFVKGGEEIIQWSHEDGEEYLRWSDFKKYLTEEVEQFEKMEEEEAGG
jgi:hypothetical protein